MTLKEYFAGTDKVFKLVCGAGNEDIEKVVALVRQFVRGGCVFFDVAANRELVRRVKEECAKENITPYICVSYGLKGDPHANKVKLLEYQHPMCPRCLRCVEACPQKAITANVVGFPIIDSAPCIGCGKCKDVCPASILTMESKPRSIKETLPGILEEGIDMVELHISGGVDYEAWQTIEQLCGDLLLSVCIDRSHHSDEDVKRVLTTMLAHRVPYSTVIQADGFPMSGNSATLETTLQAVAMGQIVNRLQLRQYILLSGGTNALTLKLAEEADVQCNGVAVGSFARSLLDKGYSPDRIMKACLNIRR